MIGLYLLAAHMVGDFVLQTRWQAAGKFDDYRLRARHVAVYCLPFIPIAAWRTISGHDGAGWHGAHAGAWAFAAFMLWLAVLHFVTDSRRFHSTLGDFIAWRFESVRRYDVTGEMPDVGGYRPRFAYGRMAPSPWPPLPILLDQSLHAVQLAILGGLFLS